MRIARFIACLGVVATLAGCAESERRNDLGTGLNTIDRDYMTSAPEAHEAALAALKRSGMTICSSCCDSLGGSSSTICYKLTVAEATGSARLAMAACDLTMTIMHEEEHLMWVEIEARQANSNPARIRIENSPCTVDLVLKVVQTALPPSRNSTLSTFHSSQYSPFSSFSSAGRAG